MNQRDQAVPDMASESDIEDQIQSKGLNAPRLSPDDIDAVIKDEDYHVFPGTTMTVCCLTLQNGYHVTGESAAASPENFDEAIGRQIARRNARDKIWALEGYLLKHHLFAYATGDVVESARVKTNGDAFNGEAELTG